MPLETRQPLHAGEIGPIQWRVRIQYRDIETEETPLIEPTRFFDEKDRAIEAVKDDFATEIGYPGEAIATITRGQWVNSDLRDDGRAVSVFESFPDTKITVVHRGSNTAWGSQEIIDRGWYDPDKHKCLRR